MGRFKIQDGHYEHSSATCDVVFAVDVLLKQKPVALKIMRDKTQFEREIDSRDLLVGHNDFIVPLLQVFPDVSSKQQQQRLDIFCNSQERQLTGFFSLFFSSGYEVFLLHFRLILLYGEKM